MGRYEPLSPNLDEHEAEGEGCGADEEGPESQGQYADHAYGGDAQGAAGDESYDPSYAQPPDDREPRLDDRLEEEVHDRLIEEAGIDPVDVAVSVTGGVVMLDGLVDDLDTRDVLEQVALDVPGVRAVDNRLRQRRGPDTEG